MSETLREKYIRLGLLTPKAHFKRMDKDDPRRVAYERRMILLGDL